MIIVIIITLGDRVEARARRRVPQAEAAQAAGGVRRLRLPGIHVYKREREREREKYIYIYIYVHI